MCPCDYFNFGNQALHRVFNWQRLGPLNFPCSFMMCYCLINRERGGEEILHTVALDSALLLHGQRPKFLHAITDENLLPLSPATRHNFSAANRYFSSQSRARRRRRRTTTCIIFALICRRDFPFSPLSMARRKLEYSWHVLHAD